MPPGVQIGWSPEQRRVIGHAALVMFVGLLAGFGLTMSLLGGFEWFPGRLLAFPVPGDAAAWARAHVGGLLNGILMITLVCVLPGLHFGTQRLRRFGWMLIGTGWANTVFYWMALVAPNRAISLGDNRWGATNLAAVLGFLPAFVFAFVMLYVTLAMARQALRGGDAGDAQGNGDG